MQTSQVKRLTFYSEGSLVWYSLNLLRMAEQKFQCISLKCIENVHNLINKYLPFSRKNVTKYNLEVDSVMFTKSFFHRFFPVVQEKKKFKHLNEKRNWTHRSKMLFVSVVCKIEIYFPSQSSKLNLTDILGRKSFACKHETFKLVFNWDPVVWWIGWSCAENFYQIVF